MDATQECHLQIENYSYEEDGEDREFSMEEEKQVVGMLGLNYLFRINH